MCCRWGERRAAFMQNEDLYASCSKCIRLKFETWAKLASVTMQNCIRLESEVNYIMDIFRKKLMYDDASRLTAVDAY